MRFWGFIDQNLRDLLNVVIAEPQSTDHGEEARKNTMESMKKRSQDKPRKGPEVKVAVASMEAA
jgi:hypothetical protein